MLNHTVWSNGWSNGWSKWLLMMPIVCSLSLLTDDPANAAEEQISELSEPQRYELNITIDGVNLDTGEFISSPLSVAELSNPDATTEELPIDRSAVDRQNELFPTPDHDQLVVDRTDLNPSDLNSPNNQET